MLSFALDAASKKDTDFKQTNIIYPTIRTEKKGAVDEGDEGGDVVEDAQDRGKTSPKEQYDSIRLCMLGKMVAGLVLV